MPPEAVASSAVSSSTAAPSAASSTPTPSPAAAPAAPSSASTSAANPQTATAGAGNPTDYQAAYRKVAAQHAGGDWKLDQQPANAPTADAGKDEKADADALPAAATVLSDDEQQALRRAAGPHFAELMAMAGQGVPLAVLRRFAGVAKTAFSNIANKWQNGEQPAASAGGADGKATDKPAGATAGAAAENPPAKPPTARDAAANPDGFVPFVLDDATRTKLAEYGDELPDLWASMFDRFNAHVATQLRQREAAIQSQHQAAQQAVHEQVGKQTFLGSVEKLRAQPGYEALKDLPDEKLAAVEDEMLAIARSLRARNPDLSFEEAIQRGTTAAVASILAIDPVTAARTSLATRTQAVRAGNPVIPQASRPSNVALTRDQYMLKAATAAKEGKSAAEIHAIYGPPPN
jgi:hypothetical protein